MSARAVYTGKTAVLHYYRAIERLHLANRLANRNLGLFLRLLLTVPRTLPHFGVGSSDTANLCREV